MAALKGQEGVTRETLMDLLASMIHHPHAKSVLQDPDALLDGIKKAQEMVDAHEQQQLEK